MIETPAARSRIMRAVKSKDTTPEITVRRLLFNEGLRYRLHRKDLPGSPDIVFSKQRKAIFVHGCFWHGHDCARGDRQPKNNADYWIAKVAKNKARDDNAMQALKAIGWGVVIVWECELKDAVSVRRKLMRFLKKPLANV